jgi:hypothetical protein
MVVKFDLDKNVFRRVMASLVGINEIYHMHMAILVYGRSVHLFTELLTFLAIVSIAVWGIVLISTLVRFIMQQLYRLRMRRSLD